jgi:hypothetical protein
LAALFLMQSISAATSELRQRYLTAKSVDEGRTSLMMSAH